MDLPLYLLCSKPKKITMTKKEDIKKIEKNWESLNQEAKEREQEEFRDLKQKEADKEKESKAKNPKSKSENSAREPRLSINL